MLFSSSQKWKHHQSQKLVCLTQIRKQNMRLKTIHRRYSSWRMLAVRIWSLPSKRCTHAETAMTLCIEKRLMMNSVKPPMSKKSKPTRTLFTPTKSKRSVSWLTITRMQLCRFSIHLKRHTWSLKTRERKFYKRSQKWLTTITVTVLLQLNSNHLKLQCTQRTIHQMLSPTSQVYQWLCTLMQLSKMSHSCSSRNR